MTYRTLLNRLADVDNRDSVQTAGVYVGKSVFSSHLPFLMQGDNVIIFNHHFIRGLRRILSGEVAEGDTGFSTEEFTFYDDYMLYLSSEYPSGGTSALELEALDFWLTEEIQNNLHPTATRDYDEDHPWRLTEEREGRLWQEIF